VALEFIDQDRGTRAVIAPDVAAINPELSQALRAADLIFFDGTFWSEDELRQIDPDARTASAMGHLPISGGSLELLRECRAQTRVYVHINNTNPILAPNSPERATVDAAGIIVGEDGMEFDR
jgi:pyrroloquinoline quinone biosynthesis protein B